MKNYFKYHLKKRAPLFLIIFVVAMICTLVAVVPEFRGFKTRLENIMAKNPTVDPMIYFKDFCLENANVYLCIVLCIFASILPMVDFHFIMNKRTVDGYLSLPIKRWKTYGVHAMVTALYTLVIYLILVITLTLSMLINGLGIYFAHVVGSTLITWGLGYIFMLALYFTNAFIFTRANNHLDGIIFIIFYALIGMLIMAYIADLFPLSSSDLYYNEFIRSIWALPSYCSTYTPLITLFSQFGTEKVVGYIACGAFTALGGAAGFGLLYTAKYRKSENAEHVSTTWYGYKIIIPILMAMGVCYSAGSSEILLVLVIVGVVLLQFLASRTYKIGWKNIIVLICSLVLGLILLAVQQVVYDIQYQEKVSAILNLIV